MTELFFKDVILLKTNNLRKKKLYDYLNGIKKLAIVHLMLSTNL